MSSTLVAVLLVLGLSASHWRIRRHAGWTASARGRFLVFLGYPAVAVAAYWLCAASTSWEWALAGGWALASAASFVAGFDALRRVTAQHAARAVAMETIEPATGAISF
ncbi:hypothetical protein KUF57_17830 [Mycolicibacterium sp. PAM1]|uniref:hypothetical protein n=1 Tax=Mycolicibacterium sp. PAM1 TaxID=2853535 RepID=UPI001C3CC565|nr:hypothetical protein [Mycolicibacterium sp. PAM1]MBV5245405.1 hypothetical protein [Mycolicibacterium sp. PAM1]